MPRQARQKGEYMHLVVRGIGKQILFEDSKDRKKYLYYLKKYSSEDDITILAYCLMENHVHLLLRSQCFDVSGFMKKMGVSYAQYFNLKYDRTGHLFQDRYKSEIVNDNIYLLAVFRYILNNPKKAGISPAEEYPWSSYCEYGETDCLTKTDIFQEQIGDEDKLRQFLRQEDSFEYMEADTAKKDDVWAQSTIRAVLHIASGTELQKYDRKKRDEALALLKRKGLTVRQIERLTGINRGVIQKAKVVSENRPH